MLAAASSSKQGRALLKFAVQLQRRWRWPQVSGRWMGIGAAVAVLLCVVLVAGGPAALTSPAPVSSVMRAIARQASNPRDDYANTFWLARVQMGAGGAEEQRQRELLQAPFMTRRDFEAELLSSPHEWQQRFFFFITKPLKKAEAGASAAASGGGAPAAAASASTEQDQLLHLFLSSLYITHPNAKVYAVLTVEDEPHMQAVSDTIQPYLAMGYHLRALHMPVSQLPRTGWWLTEGNRQWLERWCRENAVESPASPQAPYLYSHVTDYLRFWFLSTYGGTYTDSDSVFTAQLPPGAFVGVVSSTDSAPWYVDPASSTYVAPGLLRLPPGAPEAQAVLADVFDNAAYDPSCFDCVGPRPFNVMLKELAAEAIKAAPPPAAPASAAGGGGAAAGQAIAAAGSSFRGGCAAGELGAQLQLASDALSTVGSRLQLLPPNSFYPLAFWETPQLFSPVSASVDGDSDFKHAHMLRRLQRSSCSVHLFGQVVRHLPIQRNSFISYLLDQMNLRALAGTKTSGPGDKARPGTQQQQSQQASSGCKFAVLGGGPMVITQHAGYRRGLLANASTISTMHLDKSIYGNDAAAATVPIFSAPSTVFFRDCSAMAAARTVDLEISTAHDGALDYLASNSASSATNVIVRATRQQLRVTITPATVQAVNSVLESVHYRPPASHGAAGATSTTAIDQVTVRISAHKPATGAPAGGALHHSATFPMMLLDRLVTAVPYAHGPGSIHRATAAAAVFNRVFPGTHVVTIADDADVSAVVAATQADARVALRVLPGVGASSAWLQVLRDDVTTPYAFLWDADRFEITSQTHIDLLLLVLTQSGASDPIQVAAAAADTGLRMPTTPGGFPIGASGVVHREGPQGATLNVIGADANSNSSCRRVDLAPAALLARTDYLVSTRPLDPTYTHASLLPWMVSPASSPFTDASGYRRGGAVMTCGDVTVAASTPATAAIVAESTHQHTIFSSFTHHDGSSVAAAEAWALQDTARLQSDMTQLRMWSRAARLLVNGTEVAPAESDIRVADDGERLAGHENEPTTCKPTSGSCVTGNEGQSAVAAARAQWETALASEGRKLRIGFVTYATGPYNTFVEELWVGLQRWAFPDQEVHLFVFTDRANNASFLPHPHVHKKQQTRLGWPFDSLSRHYLFLKNMHWFAFMDFLYSVDSDAAVVGPLDETMLGERVGTFHYWFYGRRGQDLPNDRRLAAAAAIASAPSLAGVYSKRYSTAFITDEEANAPQAYVCGGMFGGTLDGFRAILEGVVALASADLSRNPPRVALWHDESYLNRYFIDHPPTLLLTPNFMYPEPPVDRHAFFEYPIWQLHLADGTQVDAAQTDKVVPYERSRRFVPRVLNLGVRKHVTNTLHQMQPPTATIPGVMTPDGVPRVIPTIDKAFVPDKMTFIIKAFERPTCLVRLLRSIHQFYPTVPVLVLDDSKQPMLPQGADVTVELHTLLPNLKYIRSEYDVGLAEGRNRLLQHVETPYVLLLDDDFEILDTSNIEHLLGVLEYGTFDIAGGCIDSAWGYHVLPEPGRLEIRMDMSCALSWETPRAPDYETEEVACFKTDMINNFFGARADFVRQVLWDPRLKMGEHEDFFWRVKNAGGRVGLCSGISARNDNSCDKTPQYKKLRSRVFDYWVTLFQKHSITQMKTAAGVYTLQCDGSEGKQGAAGADKPAASPGKCRIDVKQDSIWFN